MINKRQIIKKYLFVSSLCVGILIFFLVKGEFVVGNFINDLYQMQANQLLQGKFDLGFSYRDMAVLDTTLHGGRTYMSWGIFPAIIYWGLDFLYPWGVFPKTIIYIFHLWALVFIIWKSVDLKESSNFSKYVAVIFLVSTPFTSVFFSGDISALLINSLFALTYLLYGLYFQNLKKDGVAQLFYFLALLTRFSYLPYLILFNIYLTYRDRKIHRLFFMLLNTALLLFINHLKFDDFFVWGERYNKFQGEWFTIFKTLQVGSHSIPSYLGMIRDSFFGLFLNFSGETFYGTSQLISTVNSSLLIPSALGLILIALRFKRDKYKENFQFLILAVLFIAFQFTFMRFFSFRTLSELFLLLFLFFYLSSKEKKSMSLALVMIIGINFSFFNFSKNNITKKVVIEFNDEFIGTNENRITSDVKCADLSSRYTLQELHIIAPGLTADCKLNDAFSIVLNKTSARCHFSITSSELTCKSTALFNDGKWISATRTGEQCIFPIDSKHLGPKFFYVLFASQIKVTESDRTFKRAYLSCK